MTGFPGGLMTGIKKLKRILAHHAGARLYYQQTGRLPAPVELARFVTEKRNTELAAYGAEGEVATARKVLAAGSVHTDLGQIYQNLRKPQEKKDLGQVFTPMAAVEAALDLVDIRPERVIDPACGAGDFLLACRRRWPRAQLAGVDIDSLALAVAETKLRLMGTGDVSLLEANAFFLDFQGQFDLVAGNPPWGSNVPGGQSETFPPGANSFLYFLELAARLLPPGGQMVYLLPEAFTKVWTYQKARSWLLKNFAVSGLHYIPHLFAGYYAPAVILAAVKKPCPSRQAVPVWYQRDLTRAKAKHNLLPEEALQGQRFNINWNRKMEDLWQQCCQEAFYLREGEYGEKIPEGKAVVDFSLGIVTGDNRRFIRNKPAPGLHALLLAKDVTPFVTASPSRWLDYDKGGLQQAAPLEKYLVPAKIVYRFISREIIAAVDYSGSLTLNNLNIIIPISLPFALEYLAALLNSKLLNTLYMYKFFTGKVLTRQLKQIPLRQGRVEEVTGLAKKLALGKGSREELDDIIFDLYGLDSKQRLLVAAMQRRLKEMFFV